MYKEIISKFKGLNISDIYNDVIRIHPQLKDRFDRYNEFSDMGGRTRGQLLEFSVYHFMGQGALFNVMQKGADFIENDENFDMKCITLKDNNLSLSGDTPIGAFDYKKYNLSNTIQKLNHIILPIIDRNLEVIDIKEFKSKFIENDLKKDWEVIYNHIIEKKSGNCNGNHCKYLRAKNRGGKYYIMFTQNKNLNLLNISETISDDDFKIKNKRIYISSIKKQFSDVINFGDFSDDYNNLNVRELYDKYVIKNI